LALLPLTTKARTITAMAMTVAAMMAYTYFIGNPDSSLSSGEFVGCADAVGPVDVGFGLAEVEGDKVAAGVEEGEAEGSVRESSSEIT